MFVDTHCHLTKNDIKEIKNMKDNIMIVSSSNNDDIDEVIYLINNYKNIYGTVGIHPEFVDNYDLKKVEEALSNKKIVGIGEIGLDYYYRKDNKLKQKELFEKQLFLAQKYSMPVVIHSRDAIEDTYNILSKYKVKSDIHCYSGSLQMAEKFIKINSYLGIGGVLTFKKEKKLKEIVEKIDLSHILLETDSPYLSPEPLRGSKNEPANIKYIAEYIAKIKNINIEDVYKETTGNALSLFDIKLK